MKTLYITKTGRVALENDNIASVMTDRAGIDSIYMLDEDMHIVCENSDGTLNKMEGKKGQILVQFYERDFNHGAVIVDCKEWTENINAYREKMQKQKEAWAETNSMCEACDLSAQSPIA